MGVAISAIPHRVIVSDDSRYMSIAQVCARFGGRSRMWIERKLKNPVLPFPQPYRFGPGKKCHRLWLREEVLAWEVERAKLNGGAS
jgi:predicted DNA-binding transcriptional regulator AlpA